jgi:hypothetical protein
MINITDLTPEELLQKSISAAFDSVTLIQELNLLETLTEEEADRKLRNQQHLEVMMGKEDFVAGLTKAQKTQIENVL